MKVEFNALNFGIIVAVAAIAVLIIGVALIMFCASEKATEAIEQNKEEGKVTLNVLVCNARVFEKEDADAEKGDPYIVLHFNGEKKKTQVQKDTLQPEWNEEFSFAQAPLDGGEGIKVELWSEDPSEDQLVGTALIKDLNSYSEFADGARHKHVLALLNEAQVATAELEVEVWAEVQHGDASEGGDASESEGGESESEVSESQGDSTTQQSENQESSQATESSTSVTKEGDGGQQSSRTNRTTHTQNDDAPAQSTRSNQPGTSRTHATHHTTHTHRTQHTHVDGDKSTTTERSNTGSEVEAPKTTRSNATHATHHTSATHRTSATHHTHATESGGHGHGSHHHSGSHRHSGGDNTTTERTTHTSRTTNTTQTSQTKNTKSPTTSRTNASKVPSTSRKNDVSEYTTGGGGRGGSDPTEVTVVYEGEKKKKSVPKGEMGVDNTNTEWLAFLINDGRKEDKKKKAEDL